MLVEKSEFEWQYTIEDDTYIYFFLLQSTALIWFGLISNLYGIFFSLLLPIRFSTSRQTLTCIPGKGQLANIEHYIWFRPSLQHLSGAISDTFFSAMLNGRIPSMRDDSGAIFIDRDPTLFGIILNYLRTRDIDIKQCDLRILRHEAEYYNISPLVKRLILCQDLDHSSCGDIWFYGCLNPPSMFYRWFFRYILLFFHRLIFVSNQMTYFFL